jgi:hypothetical protein
VRFTVRSPPVIENGRSRSVATLLNSDVTSSVGPVPNRLGRSDEMGAMLPNTGQQVLAQVRVEGGHSAAGHLGNGQVQARRAGEEPLKGAERDADVRAAGRESDTSSDPGLKIALHGGALYARSKYG